MAKKKTFQEYTKEALYEIEKTEAALKQEEKNDLAKKKTFQEYTQEAD